MPPPSPWERAGASFPADDTPDWARLVLTGAARAWMVVAIVWGSILFLGSSAIRAAVTNKQQTTVQQYNTIVSDFNTTGRALNNAGKHIGQCSTVSCLRPSHLAAAARLTQFGNDVRAMNLPSNASGAAQQVESDTSQLSTILTRLAKSQDLQAYYNTAQTSNLDTVLNSYPHDAQNLANTVKADLG
jgi:hypothetical protein